MARMIEAHPVESKVLVDLNRRLTRDIYTLLDTGLFGKTVDEVVHGLIRERLRQLVVEGWIKR